MSISWVVPPWPFFFYLRPYLRCPTCGIRIAPQEPDKCTVFRLRYLLQSPFVPEHCVLTPPPPPRWGLDRLLYMLAKVPLHKDVQAQGMGVEAPWAQRKHVVGTVVGLIDHMGIRGATPAAARTSWTVHGH